MKLKRSGVVYAALRFVGYRDYDLRVGVSLCMTFWAIVIGIPLVMIGRAIRTWFQWIFADLADDPYPSTFQYFSFAVKALTVPLAANLLTLALILAFFKGYGLTAYFVEWMISVGVIFLFGGVILLANNGVKWAQEIGNSEVVKVIKADVVAVKEKVCPVIHFE